MVTPMLFPGETRIKWWTSAIFEQVGGSENGNVSKPSVLYEMGSYELSVSNT